MDREQRPINPMRRQLAQWALTLALICLSLAVLNWGLQYKMSLYKNINGIAHAPAAKLWMGKDGGSSQGVKLPLPEPAPAIVQATFLIVFLALFLLLRAARAIRVFLSLQHLADAPEMRLIPFRESFFFRPPPPISA